MARPQLEQALHAAVFAVAAVQDREEDIGPKPGALAEQAASRSRVHDQLPDRPVGAEADSIDVLEPGRVERLLAVQVEIVQAFAAYQSPCLVM